MLALANEVLRIFAMVAGKKAMRKFIQRMRDDQHLVSQFEMREPDQIIAFKIDSVLAIESLFMLAEEMVSDEERKQLHLSFKALRQRMRQSRKAKQ